MRGFGIDLQQKVPIWLASEGGLIKYDVNDLATLSFNLKEVLKQNSNRRIRIVIDVLSSILMLNQPETIYKFLAQLLEVVKQYDAVLLATLEEGMHKTEVLTAMQQLFDAVFIALGLVLAPVGNVIVALPALVSGLITSGTPLGQGYSLYRSAKSLVPLNRVSLVAERTVTNGSLLGTKLERQSLRLSPDSNQQRE